MQNAGFLLLNKPSGITSAKLLNQLKKLFPRRTKVGHAGTLDKFASGLLVVGISRQATQLLPHIMQLNKRYAVTVQLGVCTDTLDSTGIIQYERDCSYITDSAVVQACNYFLPSYLQEPPLYSAKKYKGVRLSDLARKGMDTSQLVSIAQSKAKEVYMSQLNIKSSCLPEVSFEVTVSHGTYIRALVRDLGDRLGTGAVTKQLCRISIGPFQLVKAITLKTLDIEQDIVAVSTIIAELESLKIP